MSECEFLTAALAYAERGWEVVPIIPLEKRPHVTWRNGGSTDPETIRGWWRQFPDADVGIITGSRSGLWTVDIDVKRPDQDGMQSFRELEAELGPLPRTAVVKTPSGGYHVHLAVDLGQVKSPRAVRPGIDIRADGGLIVMPPSRGKNAVGKVARYEWVKDIPND